MKKTITLILLILFCQVTVFSQESDFIRQLRKKVEKETKEAYDVNTTNILNKVNEGGVYRELAEEIKKKTKNASEFGEISELLNPSSTTLTGKSYNDFISSAAEDVFLNDDFFGDNEGHNKDRLKNIIGNLTDKDSNPQGSVVGSLIKGFANSNPVLSVASKVVTGIASFIKSKKRNNGNIAKLTEVIPKAKLRDFNERILPYVTFYDKALALNKEFNSNIDDILIEVLKNDSLAKIAVGDLRRTISTLEGGESITIGWLTEQFPFEFERYYLNEDLDTYNKLVEQAWLVDYYYEQTNGINQRVNLLIDTYLKEIKELLETSKPLLANSVRTEVTNLGSLDKPIQDYIAFASVSEKGNEESFIEDNIGGFEFIATRYDSDGLSKFSTSDLSGSGIISISSKSSDTCNCGRKSILDYALLVSTILASASISYFVSKRNMKEKEELKVNA